MKAPGFDEVVGADPPLDIIHSGITFGEGPVWDRRKKTLFFTEIIGDTIWEWKPGVGPKKLVHPSQHANGLTFDHEGRILVAGWGSRTIWRIEHDGSMVTLASKWDGKKLNSPNDIVVRSDGCIYWTDSAGGTVIPGMPTDDLQRYLDVQGVYCLTPKGELHLAIADCVYPNGLAFSTDEKILYVNDSRQCLIRAFDVNKDGSVGPGRLFIKLPGSEPGVADGMKVDQKDNVYCTGPGGIHVMDKGGKLLGRMRINAHCTNLAFGDDDWRTIYITTFHDVLRTRVNIPGVAVW
jgi:gluconolactonase